MIQVKKIERNKGILLTNIHVLACIYETNAMHVSLKYQNKSEKNEMRKVQLLT